MGRGTRLPNFELDHTTNGVLGGSQFTTEFVRLEGDCQDFQIRCYQSAVAEDMEIHWIEMHFTLGGVTEE